MSTICGNTVYSVTIFVKTFPRTDAPLPSRTATTGSPTEICVAHHTKQVQVQVQVQIKFIATQKIHITATFTNIIAHMVHMVKEGTWVFYKKCLHATINVPIQVICWDTTLKRKIQCSKGGYETQSGLWAPNLLNSVESYAVCIMVKVAEPVQISYTG